MKKAVVLILDGSRKVFGRMVSENVPLTAFDIFMGYREKKKSSILLSLSVFVSAVVSVSLSFCLFLVVAISA